MSSFLTCLFPYPVLVASNEMSRNVVRWFNNVISGSIAVPLYDIHYVSVFANVMHNAVNSIFLCRFYVFVQSFDLFIFVVIVQTSVVIHIFRVYDVVHHTLSWCVLSRCVLSPSLLLRYKLSRRVLVSHITLTCFHVAFHRVPFLRVATSSFCSILSYITFCRIADVLCTFFYIASVGNPFSFPLLALSIKSSTATRVDANVAQSIETVFHIPSLSIVAVLGQIPTNLNGPILVTFIYCTSQSLITLRQRLPLVCGQCTHSVRQKMAVEHCEPCRRHLCKAIAPFSFARRRLVALSLGSVAIVLAMHV